MDDRVKLPFSSQPLPQASFTLPWMLADSVSHRLPPVYRVESVVRLKGSSGKMLVRVRLFHEQASLAVEYTTRHCDIRLKRDCLVSIRWQGEPVCVDGHVRIGRLVLVEKPQPAVNLFDLVPPGWVKDRELVQRASSLWKALPRGFAHLFNALFWEGRRLYRFLTGPSSIEDHHCQTNGNFRHSVETAETAKLLASLNDFAFLPVVILAGLIHDAGKADEYEYDWGSHRHRLSAQGALFGHRDRLQQWLAAAMAEHRVIIPEAHWLSLIHALTAAKGAAPYLGLREPRSIEAAILSSADRLSGEGELIGRLATPEGGFGKYHKRFRGACFITPPSGLVV